MFKEVLVEQNPHWLGNDYEEEKEKGIQRDCFPKLLQFLGTSMIVAIMGVRRAGKSTLLKQLINHLLLVEKVAPQNILFLNVEHPYFSQYSHDIQYLQKIFESYLQLQAPTGKIYCFLDEIQFFTGWPIFIKAHFEQKKVKFVITGSNSALLSSELVTLLSGRALPIEVYPLSFRELANHKIFAGEQPTPLMLIDQRLQLQKLLEEFLHYGGFPEVIIHDHGSVAFDILQAYVKSILYQDVAPRLHVRQSSELERLFVYLVSNGGKSFSYHKLSEFSSVSDKSVKEYIKAFADSYLLFELDIFAYSLKKQIRNPKKVYAIDTGVINAVAFKFSENKGWLLENLLFIELKRLGLELFYYKTKNNLEVDFVAKKEDRYALIQVSTQLSDLTTRAREINALVKGLHEMNKKKGIIFTLDEEEEMQQEGCTIAIMALYRFLSLDNEEKLKILGLS